MKSCLIRDFSAHTAGAVDGTRVVLPPPGNKILNQTQQHEKTSDCLWPSLSVGRILFL